MKKLTTAKLALEAFTNHQLEKLNEIKGGVDTVIIVDTEVV